MLADISGLGFSRIDDNCHNDYFIYQIDDIYYINTWVGLQSRYVTPGNTVSLYNVRRLFNDAFRGIHTFEKELNEYIPQIDFSKVNTNPVNEFISGGKNSLVLISNGNVQSGQAENFDFDPIIERLCIEFSNLDFIITNTTSIEKPNLYHSKDITKSEDGFDYPELSYLSTFCNPIIGRGSGAYIQSMIKENCFSTDPVMCFIGFTHNKYGSDIAVGQELPRKVISSPETDPKKVGDVISNVLRGEYV